MRLISLAAAVALFGASGCVVRHHYVPSSGVTYREVHYRYYGAHPIPDGWGDGWCFVEHDHVHEYVPDQTHYVYRGGVYVYARPTVVWYVGYHPVPSGGHCGLHGRHSHDYHPGSALAPHYSWDRGQRVYVYRNPHPQRDPRRVEVVPPPPAYNPPPGHGGIPPGHGGTPPGHNRGGPPPGDVENPGHGHAPPPRRAESAPGFPIPPPVQVEHPGRGNEQRDHGGGPGHGNGQVDRGDVAREVRRGPPAPMNVQPAAGNDKGQPPKKEGKGRDDRGNDDKGNDGNDKRQRPPPGRVR